MKYLAAYALLALSGKKDISTGDFIQMQRISNPYSVAFNLTPLMPKSTKSLLPSREKPSINSSLRDKPV
jgi:hypothetical protein